jgi:SagB-type dehydrogenase family enzyme
VGRLYRRVDQAAVLPRQHRLVVVDYALGSERVITPLEAAVLTALDKWTSPRELVGILPGVRLRSLHAAVRRLHQHQVIESSDETEHRRRRRLKRWASWSPEAALFHFSTKNGTHASLDEAIESVEEWRILDPVDHSPRARRRRARVALDDVDAETPFARVLNARRSWRRFGPDKVSLSDLSTLLGLTWGVQGWMHVRPEMRLALKTSPSAGACHPIEAYVVARRLEKVPPGVYHYDADRHELERIRRGLPASAVTALLRQSWFKDCAAVFFMTAVWQRSQWKYRFPRAYRTVLLEAGHFAQTFCLTATSLGLAPFCTASFADSRVERLLRIDGITEGVIYATGVGSRPPRTTWAPWPLPYGPVTIHPPGRAAARTLGARTRRKR